MRQTGKGTESSYSLHLIALVGLKTIIGQIAGFVGEGSLGGAQPLSLPVSFRLEAYRRGFQEIGGPQHKFGGLTQAGFRRSPWTAPFLLKI